MVRLLGILFLLLTACSPEGNRKNFGDDKEFHNVGPKFSDLDLSNRNFAINYFDLKSFEAEMSSSMLFDTSAYIFRSGLLEDQSLEKESHKLSYDILEDVYQLSGLKALIEQLDKAETKRGFLRKIYDGVVYRNAYSLSSYKQKLSNYLTYEEMQSFSFPYTDEEAEYLTALSEAISKTRFIGAQAEVLRTRFDKDFQGQATTKLLGWKNKLDKLIDKKEAEVYSNELSSGLYIKSLDLLNQFYESPVNYSSYELDSSNYIETALGLYGGDVFQTWSSTMQNIRLKVKAAFDKLDFEIKPPEEEDYHHPERVVLKLDKELSEIVPLLIEEGVDPLGVQSVSDNINSLRPLIEFAIENMSQMKTDIRLKKNVILFDEVLKKLEIANIFPETVLKTVEKEVQFPKEIRSLMNVIEDQESSLELRLGIARTIIIRIFKYLRAQVELELKQVIDSGKVEECRKIYSHMMYMRGGRYADGSNIYSMYDEECLKEKVPQSAWDRFFFRADGIRKSIDVPMLVWSLLSLSEEDLDYLSRVDEENHDTDSSWWYPFLTYIESEIDDYVIEKSKDDQDPDMILGFVAEIETAVNAAFLKKVSIRLTDELANFDQVVENKIISSVNDVDLGPKDFYFKMKEFALIELSTKIMDGRDDLNHPHYEASRINYKLLDNKWHLQTLDPSKEFFETSASALTSSAIARSLSFWNYSTLDSSVKDRLEQKASMKKRAFDLINKMVSLLGARDYFGRLVPSLITNAESKIPKRLDIYTHAYDKEIFGLPDEIKLSRSQSGYLLEAVEEKRSISLNSQAGLLQAGTDFMKLMADWEESPLDKSIHKIVYQGVNFFPKESLIELGLGLSSVVLRNLHKEGLKLFDRGRNPLDLGGDGNTDEVAEKVSSSVVLSFLGKTATSKVDTKALAKYMLALYDFIRVAERINLSRSNSAVYLIPGENNSALKQLDDAVALLKKLYIALANFMSSRLLNDEFLFVSSFDLESKTASEGPVLETQALARLALFRAYKLWDAKIYLWAVVDNYYRSSHRFIDRNSGLFYSGQSWGPYLLSENYFVLRELSLDSEFKQLLGVKSFRQLQRIIHKHEEALLGIL